MSKRLNIDRQEELEPERMEYSKKAITDMGYKITGETKTWIRFYYKECPIMFYPYSGWAKKLSSMRRQMTNIISSLTKPNGCNTPASKIKTVKKFMKGIL